MKARAKKIAIALIYLVSFLLSGILLYFAFYFSFRSGNISFQIFMLIISILLTIYFGMELYSLRKYVPIIYGALEICIGLYTLLAYFLHKFGIYDITGLFYVFAALYIIVRGLDNLDRHYKDKAHDWFKRLLDKKLLLSKYYEKLLHSVEGNDTSDYQI